MFSTHHHLAFVGCTPDRDELSSPARQCGTVCGGGLFLHAFSLRLLDRSVFPKRSMSESTVPMPPGSPWNERQIARFLGRTAMFVRRGMTEQEAEQFADRLAVRDAEKDDRRACIECAAFQQDGKCSKHKNGLHPDTLSRDFTPMPAVLQRCPVFEFQVPA